MINFCLIIFAALNIDSDSDMLIFIRYGTEERMDAA